MRSNTAPRPPGLRERKRRATENSIERAAVRLALELGVENVTVDLVCARAEISRSTFFNYFSTRDSAIVGRAVALPEGDAAFAVLGTCPDDLARGIFRLIFSAIGHNNVNAEVAGLRGKLFAEQPTSLRMALLATIESGHHLIDTAAAWLRANPERQRLDDPVREASLAASIAHGAIMAQLPVWAQGQGDVPALESDFDAVIADFRRLLG